MPTADPITELESRVAFQEDAIDKLSDVIARQEKEIERLTRMVQILNNQIKQIDGGPFTDVGDQLPPHY